MEAGKELKAPFQLVSFVLWKHTIVTGQGLRQHKFLPVNVNGSTKNWLIKLKFSWKTETKCIFLNEDQSLENGNAPAKLWISPGLEVVMGDSEFPPGLTEQENWGALLLCCSAKGRSSQPGYQSEQGRLLLSSPQCECPGWFLERLQGCSASLK